MNKIILLIFIFAIFPFQNYAKSRYDYDYIEKQPVVSTKMKYKELENASLYDYIEKQPVVSTKMKYKELENALFSFLDSTTSCKVIEKYLPELSKVSSYKNKKNKEEKITGRSKKFKYLSDIAHQSISFKIKKEKLFKEFDKEIKYIINCYSMQRQRLIEECFAKKFADNLLGNFCCWWHLRLLALKGVPMALYTLGCLSGGEEEALACLRLAAVSGVKEAYFELGERCWNAREYKVAIDFYKKGIKAGDSRCASRLAEKYYENNLYKEALDYEMKAFAMKADYIPSPWGIHHMINECRDNDKITAKEAIRICSLLLERIEKLKNYAPEERKKDIKTLKRYIKKYELEIEE